MADIYKDGLLSISVHAGPVRRDSQSNGRDIGHIDRASTGKVFQDDVSDIFGAAQLVIHDSEIEARAILKTPGRRDDIGRRDCGLDIGHGKTARAEAGWVE